MDNEHGREAAPTGDDGEAARAQRAVRLADRIGRADKCEDAEVVDGMGEEVIRN